MTLSRNLLWQVCRSLCRLRAVQVVQTLACGALALAVCVAHAESGNPDPDAVSIEKSGNLLQWGIPLVGWGLTYLLNQSQDSDDFAWQLADGANAPGLNWPGPRLNRSPRHDFLVSFTRMEVATYALKYSINAQRPNGGSHSFPSGHTASAFMGAEFIRLHFGMSWGIPAYGAAAWVGYSRVESRKHYWRDVAAGALIGIAANYDFSNVNTSLGKLSVGPTLMSAAGQDTSSCDAGPSPGCFRGQPTLVPGLQIQLRF
jgi:hypothetical protein